MKDTIVISISRPESSQREYFLKIDNDSSGFSLFVDTNSFGKLTLKYAQVFDRLDFEGDSFAIEMGPRIKEFLPITSFSAQLSEISLLLKRASSEFNFEKTAYLRIGLSDLIGFAEALTRTYFGSEKQKTLKKSVVLDLVKRSDYVAQLNLILASFGYTISDLSIDGLALCRSRRSSFLDGTLILSLKPIN